MTEYSSVMEMVESTSDDPSFVQEMRVRLREKHAAIDATVSHWRELLDEAVKQNLEDSEECEEGEDECDPVPTEYARERFLKEIELSRLLLGRDLPDRTVIPDYGGIRVEWWASERSHRHVVLVVGRDVKSESYVFSDTDGSAGVHQDTSTLAESLKELQCR